MLFKNSVVRAIALILFLCMTFVLCGIVIEDAKAEKEAERIDTLIQKELITSGLLSEKTAIERELSVLLDKERDRLPTVTFIFREPARAIFDSIRPVMTIFGIRATIAISPSSMPGGAGNLTLEQYSALLGEGYSSAVLYDATAPLSDYLATLRGLCNDSGIAMPKVLYVCGTVQNRGAWLTEYDSDGNPVFTNEIKQVLLENGIDYVVQETYQTKIVAYENFYEDFVYCESLGFNAMNESVGRLASGSLYATVKNKAAVVYSINFEFDNSYGAFYGEYDPRVSAGDGTTTDDFARMLRAVSDYGSNIKITDVASVAKYREEYNKRLEIDAETDVRIAQLEARLVEVNAAIEEIKRKYD